MTDKNQTTETPSLQAYKEVVKGTGVVLVGVILGFLFNYLFKIILGRYYGPSAYGMFSLGAAILAIFSSISLLGLNIGIARFIPLFQTRKEHEKLKGALVFSTKTIILTSIIFATIIYANASWISIHIFKNKELISITKLFAVTIPFLAIFNYILGIFRGLKNMKSLVLCNNFLNWLLRLLILVGLIALGFSIHSTPWAYLISIILIGLLAIFLIKKTRFYQTIKKVKTKNASREILSFSLPLAGSLVINISRKKIDVLFIGFFLSSQQVGFYNAALPIAMLLPSFLYAINKIIMPVASELYGGNKLKELAMVYKNVARWAMIITLPLFFLFIFFPELVLQTLFGEDFTPATLSLIILSIGMFINVLSGPLGELLNAFGKTKYILFISTISIVVNIALMLLLIPRFGIIGAAFSITFTSFIFELMALIYLKIKKNMHPFSLEYAKSLILGLLLFTPLSYISKNYLVGEQIAPIILVFLLATCFYLLLLNKLNVFTAEDKEIFTAIKNRLLSHNN